MKFVPALLVAPLLAAGLTVAVPTAAHAAATDPVTDLSAHVLQSAGSKTNWDITATWTANPDVTRYRVAIADNAQGDDPLVQVERTAASVEFNTPAPAENSDYYVVVTPVAPSVGTAAAAPIHTGSLDTTPPTGTYKLNRTSAYYGEVMSSEDSTVPFRITQVAMEGAVKRQVNQGDRSALKDWSKGSVFVLGYDTPGRYTPSVILTDAYGNTAEFTLPTVRVITDGIAPRVRITLPAKSNKIRSWRKIHGTASDVGSGLAMAMALVLVKRDGVWWVYDFSKRKWVKGYSSVTKTESKVEAMPAMLTVDKAGRWTTPTIKGMKKGTLRVEAAALDNEFNIGSAPVVTRKIR